VFAVGANASTASKSASARSSSLCSVSKAVASDIVHSTAVKPTDTSAYLKTVYGKIHAAESTLVSAASGSIKSDLHKVFGFVNVLITDLKKANWNVAGLAPYEKTLTADAAKIKTPLAALKHYYSTTCKLHV
jgi:hypothetical protein